MISGKFGDEDELFFEIDLIAADGLEIPVDALFDTGFFWWLAINNQDLEALDWIYVEQQTMLTAQGDAEFDIYLEGGVGGYNTPAIIFDLAGDTWTYHAY